MGSQKSLRAPLSAWSGLLYHLTHTSQCRRRTRWIRPSAPKPELLSAIGSVADAGRWERIAGAGGGREGHLNPVPLRHAVHSPKQVELPGLGAAFVFGHRHRRAPRLVPAPNAERLIKPLPSRGQSQNTGRMSLLIDSEYSIPNRFIWVRAEAEAGEGLKAILERKEQEAAQNRGVFWWGFCSRSFTAVNLQRFLASFQGAPVEVLFTELASKPQSMDEHPESVYEFTSAHSLLTGATVEIPASVHVTARQTRRLALVCEARPGFDHQRLSGTELHFSSARNALTGGKLAGQDTTSMVTYQSGAAASGHGYPEILRARLVHPYVVELTGTVSKG